jgi:hypothetical protein
MATCRHGQSPPRCSGINHLALALKLPFGGAEDPDARNKETNGPPDVLRSTGDQILMKNKVAFRCPLRVTASLAYFRRQPDGWTLVGFERIPGGKPPASKAAQARR